uniref:Uncharacterized protein n=1 Tax=Knipowitschia caucasica TaxID=637954 RepID=A0AAV2ISW7_KNICA
MLAACCLRDLAGQKLRKGEDFTKRWVLLSPSAPDGGAQKTMAEGFVKVPEFLNGIWTPQTAQGRGFWAACQLEPAALSQEVSFERIQRQVLQDSRQLGLRRRGENHSGLGSYSADHQQFSLWPQRVQLIRADSLMGFNMVLDRPVLLLGQGS